MHWWRTNSNVNDSYILVPLVYLVYFSSTCTYLLNVVLKLRLRISLYSWNENLRRSKSNLGNTMKNAKKDEQPNSKSDNWLTSATSCLCYQGLRCFKMVLEGQPVLFPDHVVIEDLAWFHLVYIYFLVKRLDFTCLDQLIFPHNQF